MYRGYIYSTHLRVANQKGSPAGLRSGPGEIAPKNGVAMPAVDASAAIMMMLVQQRHQAQTLKFPVLCQGSLEGLRHTVVVPRDADERGHLEEPIAETTARLCEGQCWGGRIGELEP